MDVVKYRARMMYERKRIVPRILLGGLANATTLVRSAIVKKKVSYSEIFERTIFHSDISRTRRD